MRPNIPTQEEVLRFFREATRNEKTEVAKVAVDWFFRKADLESREEMAQRLFDTVEDITISPPKTQHALVLHTLIFPPKEISVGYWSWKYRIVKWSTRLGEVEKMTGKILVSREQKDFVNRFGHKSTYTVYKTILDREEYISLYNEINL